MNRLASIAIALALSFGGCGSGSSSDSTGSTSVPGQFAPPAWIQGSWAGGSPLVLHLTFTKNSILNRDGKDALPGYTETGSTSTQYLLEHDNEHSYFEQINSAKLSWFIDNGTVSNTVVMTKQ
jgi:hypothetical protein